MAQKDAVELRRLLVRGFPSWLARQEQESLLSHFGATQVSSMPRTGRMRNCAFATFSNPDEAKRALSKLHQLEVLGSRLVVEFARPQHTRLVQETEADRWECNTSRINEEDEVSELESENKSTAEPRDTTRAPPLPPSHHLHYLYPPPTPTTLNNIANALACIPKLYVQVLHLMNKMNLPPPFGLPTPTPPLPADDHTHFPPETAAMEEPGLSSEEEGSEIESDDETRRKLTTKLAKPRKTVKRRAMSFKQMKGLAPLPKRRRSGDAAELEEMQTPIMQVKKIEIHMPTEVRPRPPQAQLPVQEILIGEKTKATSTEHLGTFSLNGSPAGSRVSGVVSQVVAVAQQESTSESGDFDDFVSKEELEGEATSEQKFISLAELVANRISEDEMKESSAFKNYTAGEPSLRLYIKNLAKQVSEKDLQYIFGRYIDWNSEKQVNMFDIRVMHSGRMKGQAFVGMPTEEVALKALTETNGYMLHGKPIAVHFARSARPKEKE